MNCCWNPFSPHEPAQSMFYDDVLNHLQNKPPQISSNKKLHTVRTHTIPLSEPGKGQRSQVWKSSSCAFTACRAAGVRVPSIIELHALFAPICFSISLIVLTESFPVRNRSVHIVPGLRSVFRVEHNGASDGGSLQEQI